MHYAYLYHTLEWLLTMKQKYAYYLTKQELIDLLATITRHATII